MSVKIFCFSHAGGSAHRYRRYLSTLANAAKVIPVEMPGRGERLSEAFYGSKEALVKDLGTRVYHSIERGDRFCLFGYSMGALISLEVARYLESFALVADHLFLLGRNQPNYRPILSKSVSALDDQELVEELARLGGIPKDVREHNMMKEFFLPIIRADFKLLEQFYEDTSCVPIRSDIAVFNGDEELEWFPLERESWERVTIGECRFFQYPGGHFFLEEHSGLVVDDMKQILSTKLAK